jgi:hypothetical protein
VKARSPGVRNGGWPSWGRVRGNGGAGSGPRRCAAALEAAGQAASSITARLPVAPVAYGAVLPRIVQRILRLVPAPAHEFGQGRAARRAEGVPLMSM